MTSTLLEPGMASPTRESYDELEKAYNFFNDRLFSGQLPPVLFTYQRNKRTYGYFTPERFGRTGGDHSHELAMNPVFFVLQPVEIILANLVHNMVHCWQYEHGKPGCQGYHNREFAERMKHIGLFPSDTNEPGGKTTGDKMGHYIIPGGAFITAAKDLLASAWAITWFDRFPPMSERPGAYVAGSAGPTADGPAVDSPDEANQISPAMIQADAELDIEAAPVQENRSNRNKYSCPACLAVNVWGRPGLRVMCEDCGVRLVEEGAAGQVVAAQEPEQ